eukprot:1877933-Rhodomonas_salina.1
MMNELTILCEGAVTGDFAYHYARMKHASAIALAAIASSQEPRTIAEALDPSSDDADAWWNSVEQELKSWHDLCVYTLIDKEDLKHQAVEIIDEKIVFKLKVDEFSNP